MTDKLRFASLQSGSNGNCLFVETRGVRLLFDAGITGLQTQKRLALFDVDINTVQAVIISHAHSDHIYYAGVLQRQFNLPVWMTSGTYRKVVESRNLGNVAEPQIFSAGDTLQFGHVRIETVLTPHDAPESVCFVADDGRVRLGIMSDLGGIFPGLQEIVAGLDGIYIESNYDSEMLLNGPYPVELQQRIRSGAGHLSNVETAELLRCAVDRLRWVCLGHLSKENNDPQKALQTHRAILGEHLPLYVASRYEVSEILEL
jgi:phosphoribosyl 1,2-cyclic phosphodiesterase